MPRLARGPRPVIFALFFLSGATSLVYQVLWLRMLILIFGSTLFATSAILSTFMGGLALGAFLAGRTMDRSSRSPLQVYGVLEIGIGIYALAVPVLFDLLSPLYRIVWNSGGSESLIALNLAKFLGIATVLIVPTTLMGASLPVLARQVADDPDRIGGKVGTLYAINTFGAVAGTFFAGFVMIPGIGVQRTLWITAAANLALGLVAIALARGTYPIWETPKGEDSAGRIGGRGRILLVLFAVSGFGAMVLEVAWTRALAMVLGSSVYAFSLMLVAFLIGLASGGAFFAGLLRRRSALHPGTLLSALLLATGLFAYTSVLLFRHLPQMFGEVYFAWHPGPEGWFGIQFLFGLVVMFPATFAFGGIFPAVLQLHARGLDHVAGSVGTVYAANTVGTIVGAGIAGFVLIPHLGVQNSVVAVAMVQVVLGAVALVSVSGVSPRWRTGLALACAAVAVVFPVVRPGWDALLMNSGVYMNLQDLPDDSGWEDFVRTTTEDTVVVYAREGMTASVMVADQLEFKNRYLAVNGKIEASTNADMETQLMCAHVPLLIHPGPSAVMVIGLASGITVGAAAAHPVDSIRVVEVEAAMLPAAELFSEFNGDIMRDPRVEFSINDARNELEFSTATYDVIVSEPSNPWMTVASNLFTEEFFRLAGTRLRPGGMFAQWVQNYYLPAEDLRSIIAAFHAAFPNVLVFETFEGVDLLLVGSSDPLVMDLDRIAARMAELRVRMDLARIDVRRPADLLALFRMGSVEVAGLVDGAPRNTDDNARVEFSAPKALYINTLDRNLEILERHAADPLDYVAAPLDDDAERDRLLLEIADSWFRRGNRERAAEIAAGALDGPLAIQARDLLTRLDAL